MWGKSDGALIPASLCVPDDVMGTTKSIVWDVASYWSNVRIIPEIKINSDLEHFQIVETLRSTCSLFESEILL